MNTKLTLSVDADAIETGKRAAKAAGKSLSKMVEDYLFILGQTPKDDVALPISPGLQSLVGIGSGSFDESDCKAHRVEREL